MVIVNRTNIFPAPDKAGEARSILEKFIRSNPNNIRIGLLQDVIGETPAFQMVTVFDSLEDYEKNRDSNNANDEFIQARNQISALVREPFVVRLASSIVEPLGQIGPEQRYARQVIFQPTGGAQDEVRGIVEELAKSQQADGRPLFRATESLLGHAGPAFSVVDNYETLAELENLMRQRSAVRAELRSNLAGKLRAPTLIRLREVIVPFSN